MHVPKEWEVINGEKLFALHSGVSPSEIKFTKNSSDTLFVQIDDMNKIGNSKEIIDARLLFNQNDNPNIPIEEQNTIIFPKRGASIMTNKVRIIRKRSALDPNIMALICNDGLLHYSFMYYYLLNLKLYNLMENAGLPQLNNKDLYPRLFVIPPLNEQMEISSILSRVDELIQKTDQVIEQTQRLKKGLMQRLLVKGIGHERYKSVRFGPLFLEYEIPDKWQVLTLEQCVRRDVPITYGIVQAGPHVPGGIPYIRTGDMSGDRLSKDSMLHTSKEIASSFQRSQVKAGEIVCALRGIVGKVLEVPEELEGANLTQGTARISPRHDVDRRYLLWALQSESARRQFEIFSKGTTLNEITLAQLRTIKVGVPTDINEQLELAHILDQLELMIDLQQRYKEKVAILKAGLMQNLLTGKIRVKV